MFKVKFLRLEKIDRVDYNGGLYRIFWKVSFRGFFKGVFYNMLGSLIIVF